MRFLTEPRSRKHVKGYGFLSFATKFGDKYGKKLMDTATKTEIDAAKPAFKRVVQKTAEATGDFIGLIKLLQQKKKNSNQKKKKKQKKQKKFTFYQKKKFLKQIIDDLKLL